jgi:hypothetical protein
VTSSTAATSERSEAKFEEKGDQEMVSYLATAALAISVLASAPGPVEWQADYGKALAETRSDGQPLLVVLDKPQSDDARIEPTLLGEGAAEGQKAEHLNEYNLCHVDVTTDYGQKVAKAFKAESFPHTAIIDKAGSVIIFAKSGKIDGSEWNTVLAKHKDGVRPAARRVSYKISDGSTSGTTQSATPVYRNPNYCPSCQRRSM